MSDTLRQRVVLRLPGIGWRTELLARRAQQVDALRSRVGGLQDEVSRLQVEATHLREEVRKASGQLDAHTIAPSFRRNLLSLRRNVEALRLIDPRADHPLLQIPRKLRNYRLAASHGVPVPEVLGVWPAVDDIDLSEMPEEFVLKSDRGAGGKGVFPLRRAAAGTFQVIGGDGTTVTVDDLRQHFRDHRASRSPYFAEAFLKQPGGIEAIPDDIKVYAMYGEVGHVMLRRMPKHADLRAARYRYVTPDGVDLGADVAPGHRIDSTIELPDSFAELVQIARHLSRAVSLPFIRVDVYDTVNGPVLGELTRAPGGPQAYRADHDEHMGALWDLAQYRLDLDVQRGRPLCILHGEHPAPNPYLSDRTGRPGPGDREIVTAPCSAWCLTG